MKQKYTYSLLWVCQELHMNILGSSDTLSRVEQKEIYQTICDRLANWRDSEKYAWPSNSTIVFDEAVRELCCAVRSEYERRLTEEERGKRELVRNND